MDFASLDINMAFLIWLTYQGLAEATCEKGECGVLYLAAGISIGASTLAGIRALRRVEALLSLPRARHWHQGCTLSLLTEAQKDHERIWFQTHVQRRGARDKQ
eukprot:6260027-Pyramimonas_sp.AAC.1